MIHPFLLKLCSSPEHNVEGGSTVVESEEVDMWSVPLKEEAEKQMITVTQLLGYLLYRVNYTDDKTG